MNKKHKQLITVIALAGLIGLGAFGLVKKFGRPVRRRLLMWPQLL
ncbi:MAG: hypothetical protein Q8N21_05290 [bacterium]|nr:hypothetical protein [bacterium]